LLDWSTVTSWPVALSDKRFIGLRIRSCLITKVNYLVSEHQKLSNWAQKWEKLIPDRAAGLNLSKLYTHDDHTFSAIFPKIPPLSLEQRMTKLTTACHTIIILESGRLPNTQEPYIDFGFTAPPEG
jgi:hypothetical protein